ncbi:MAG TPA: hypothetical protein VJ983_03175, partial [candidate division Zixibacteria bacterium]|nr:hypothetical protein [candidate division Zixibacteria bacterium]
GLLLVAAVLAGAYGCKKKGIVVPPPVTVGGIFADHGLYYKAVMGTSNITPPLTFTVNDDKGQPVAGAIVRCSRIVGDGTILADSLKTDNAGHVTFSYSFNGNRGDAILMAKVPGVDSETVNVRANTLIPGNGGQAQYILLSDKYRDVKDYDGTPASIDADPANWVVYANYEQALGVVVVLPDVKHDSTAVDSAEVLSIIVNTVYTGKTKDSIGIGSTLQAVRAVYGDPDTIKYDPPSPPIYIRYVDQGLLFYGDTQLLNGIPTLDTIMHEIHFNDAVPIIAPTGKVAPISGTSPTNSAFNHGYHRISSRQ